MEPEARFREYPSIELSTRGNFVEKIKTKYADPKYLWVASEKIHGSNFSVFCDGNIVKYGRRNDFITKEIPVKEQKVEGYFLQSFYDAKNLVLKFHSKLGELFEDFKKKYPDIVSFTLYGEYFGGNWIKKDIAKQKAVQTGITYTPFHEFMVFDVNVKTQTGDFWVPVTDIEGFVGKYIKTVPIFTKGSFEEVYAVNTKIDSTIPELLGLEKVIPNLIEGMVLRPNETFFEEDQRVILKKKNAEFQEKGPAEVVAKKGGKKEEKELPVEIAAPVDFLSAYVNKNRIESVLSKFPDVKDRNKLKKQIYEDVLKDAEKDEFKAPEGDVLKKVAAEIDKKIMKALNEYFTTH